MTNLTPGRWWWPEPTAGTWLPLAHAVTDAGCDIGFVANRDSARLRKAIVGANKTDVIDADMLAHCEEVLGVVAAPVPPPGQIALRRALRRRHIATVDACRVECRLWAFSDVCKRYTLVGVGTSAGS